MFIRRDVEYQSMNWKGSLGASSGFITGAVLPELCGRVFQVGEGRFCLGTVPTPRGLYVALNRIRSAGPILGTVEVCVGTIVSRLVEESG